MFPFIAYFIGHLWIWYFYIISWSNPESNWGDRSSIIMDTYIFKSNNLVSQSGTNSFNYRTSFIKTTNCKDHKKVIMANILILTHRTAPGANNVNTRLNAWQTATRLLNPGLPLSEYKEAKSMSIEKLNNRLRVYS